MLVRVRKFVQGSEGTVMVMMALGLVAFLGLASLAVDMGNLYVAKNELQNVADAAALAGARQLIDNSNGTAVVDSTAAQAAAMGVAQTQAQLSNQASLPDASRTDLSIAFGNWNIYAGSPSTAWTTTDGSASSNSNAVQVTIQRASGLAYGPVTNYLAGILGYNTTNVSATATAYLGFANTTTTGAVDLPIAVPSSLVTAFYPQPKSWLARMLSPNEAVASAPAPVTFKDLASATFYSSNTGEPLFDTTKPYIFTVNQGDSVPGTFVDNITYQYSKSSGAPIGTLSRGSRLWPCSEYQWASNLYSIFNGLKSAYTAKKDSSGNYRVMVPVYSTTNPLASSWQQRWKALAGLFSFGPTPAYACFQFASQSYPGGNVPIYVEGYTTVAVTNVTVYNPVAQKSPTGTNCSDCSSYSTWGYATQADCMVNNAKSCRNLDSITIQPASGSTVSNPGTYAGGPDNQHMNSTASANKGVFSTEVKLVQ